jgi:hypothetical protein
LKEEAKEKMKAKVKGERRVLVKQVNEQKSRLNQAKSIDQPVKTELDKQEPQPRIQVKGD